MAAGQLILASARVCHGTWRFKRKDTCYKHTHTSVQRSLDSCGKGAEHVLGDIYSINRREQLVTVAAVPLKPEALQHFPGRAVQNTGLPACLPHTLTHSPIWPTNSILMPLCSSLFPGYLSVTLTFPATVSPS